MLKPKPKKQQQTALPATLPGLFFERMEPKILMSADALSGLVTSDPFANNDTAGLSLHASVDLINATHGADNTSLADTAGSQSLLLDALGGLLDSANTQTLRQEIIFVDAATPDYQQLIDGLQTDAGTQYQVFILQSNQDGIAQISETLEGLHNIDAIHLVSHGSDEGVQLGDVFLSNDNLGNYNAQLQQWAVALDEDADLLIYGCELASAEAGQSLIDNLAELTSADVAASDDLTGAAVLGGDWVLEYTIGQIDSNVFVNASMQQGWNNVLESINVTTVNDFIDLDADLSSLAALEAAPGNDGFVSLREAIIAANNGAGADEIVLAAGTYSLGLAVPLFSDNNSYEGDLDITEALTIRGDSAATTIIDGDLINERNFDVRTSGAVFADLTIENGGTTATLGGALRITAGSDATLTDVVIRNNQGDDGAGIFNDQGTLNLNRVVFSGNTASGSGGAIFNEAGIVNGTDVEFSGNTATGNGGAIDNNGTVNLDRVLFYNNSANVGGAISNAGGEVTLTNATLSSNIAATNAGAISNQEGALFTPGVLSITNSTLTGNTDGIFQLGSSSISLVNSILNNTGSNLSGGLRTTIEYNIDSDNSAALGGGTNIIGNPLLDVLADNSGFTRTHALFAGSIAINPVGLTGAPAVDQRGLARDSTADIGAYERGAIYSTTTQLWMSTNGIADDGASPTFTFNSNEIAILNDPNLNFELGDGSTGVTDGTVSNEFVLPENMRALHYVSTNVTVNTFVGGVEGSYDLREGQVVLSMRADDTLDFILPTVSGGTISVNNTDLLVYSADTGEYEILLQDAIFKDDGTTPANIHAITIVERDTTIGVDTTLLAGTYIFAGSDPAIHANVYIYNNAIAGSQLLLTGANFLSDPSKQIQGLELIETQLSLSGATLNAGTLLVTVASDNPLTIGTSGGTTVLADQIDVVALTINATELDSGAPVSNSYLDQFNTAASYSGNDGSLTWTNDWQEIGEADGADAGNVYVWNELSEQGLEIWKKNNAGVWREADLSSAARAVLSFDWAMLSTDVGDSATVEVSIDGGLTWAVIDTFDGPLNMGAMQSASYDISGYIDVDTRIKFETITGFAVNDTFFFDNVNIDLYAPVTNTNVDAQIFFDGSDLGLVVDDGGNPGEINGLSITNSVSISPDSAPVMANNNLAITEDTTTTITNAMLSATDADTADGSMTFTVSNVLGGQFELASSPGFAITGFTQAQITANAVVFVDDGNDTAPSFDVNVSDGTTTTSTVTGGVTFTNVDDAPILANNDLAITEDITTTITNAMLSATDADTADGSVTFTVSSVLGGQFELTSNVGVAISSFTQSQITSNLVVFVDDGNEVAPSFDVNVSDGTTTTATVTGGVTFTNADDAPTLSNNNLVITEDTTTTITNAMLSASDVDTVDGSVTFTVSSVLGGQFELTSNVGVAITSFTQSQITSNLVVFVDDGNEVAPSFDVNVSDGTTTTTTVTGGVTFTNADDAPILSNNNLEITEGATTTITSAMLSANDVDTTDANVTFTVSSVLGGQFELTSNADIAITSFTQAQITSNVVVFVDDGNETIPSYSVSVSDGVTATAVTPGVVSFTNVNDEPTLTTAATNPTFTEGGSAVNLFRATSINPIEVGQTIEQLVFTVTNVSGSVEEQLIIDGDVVALNNGANGTGTTSANNYGYSVRVTNNIATVTLTITGTTALDAQALVDGMAYVNSSDDPSLGNRVVTLTSMTDSGGVVNGGDDTVNPSISSTVSIINVDDDPTLDNAIANQSATENTAFSFTFAANTFSDADGDALTYSATLSGGAALPTWLSFDSATRTFSGTPLNADVGTIRIDVTADDGNGGAVAIDTFNLVISNVSDAPTVTIDEVVDQPSTNVSEEAVVSPATEVEPESEASETTVNEIIADAETGSIAVDGGAPDFNTLGLPDATVNNEETGDNTPARPTNNHTTDKENAAGNNAGDDEALDRVRQEIAFLKDPLHLIGADSLLIKLNDMREELVMEKQDTAKVVGGSLTISAGLSIGYVVWLAKSGAVMSSMLSTLPAWRFIDPMPVLMSMQYQDADEDEESLESMVVDKELDQETLAEEKRNDA